MKRWDHQERGVREVWESFDAGETDLALTSPTGGGKSVIMVDVIEEARRRGMTVELLSHRIMLTEQISGVLAKHGISHGINARGWPRSIGEMVQLSSIQTVTSRKIPVDAPGLLIVDEVHLNKAGMAWERWKQHHLKLGVTATPLDIGHLCKKLVVAGTNTEMRKCGAHVPCHVYGGAEVDMRGFKAKVKVADYELCEYSDQTVAKAFMRPQVFGNVLEWYQLNPERRPAILFGPSVEGSIWFARQFERAGVTAAHIDGKGVYLNGEYITPSSPTEMRELRESILNGSRDGRINVVCNRFVLREAIDMPWIYHGIGATVFGGLTTYLQAVGRLLRNHDSLDHVIWQCHGGSWWRFGSPNQDREWNLEYNDRIVAGLRSNRIREGKEREPVLCVKCNKPFIPPRPACPWCGAKPSAKSRPVIQKDGTLTAMKGDTFKPRRVLERPNTKDIWVQCYRRAKNSKNGMTFNQARGLFFYENYYYPPQDKMPFMPKSEIDWFRKVKDVPTEALT